MQAQSVTERERIHEQDREREGDTGRKAESPGSAGRREEARGRRTREVGGEWEEGGKDDGAQKQAPSKGVSSALCAADMTLSTGLC